VTDDGFKQYTFISEYRTSDISICGFQVLIESVKQVVGKYKVLLEKVSNTQNYIMKLTIIQAFKLKLGEIKFIKRAENSPEDI
jgi:hypothetical protein